MLYEAALPAMGYHELRAWGRVTDGPLGCNARVAMEILGHAQISTTMDIYRHVAPEFQHETAERTAASPWARA